MPRDKASPSAGFWETCTSDEDLVELLRSQSDFVNTAAIFLEVMPGGSQPGPIMAALLIIAFRIITSVTSHFDFEAMALKLSRHSVGSFGTQCTVAVAPSAPEGGCSSCCWGCWAAMLTPACNSASEPWRPWAENIG